MSAILSSTKCLVLVYENWQSDICYNIGVAIFLGMLLQNVHRDFERSVWKSKVLAKLISVQSPPNIFTLP